MLIRSAALFIIFLMLISCKKPLAPEPDIPEISIQFNNDYISVYSYTDVNGFVLRLNGSEVPVDWYFYSAYVGWYGQVLTDSLPGNVLYQAGENILVQAQFPNKNYECEIQLIEIPVVNWPVFDPANDFTFTWQLSENSENQSVNLLLMEGLKTEMNDFKLSDEQRSYTISKNYFKEFSSDSASIGVTLRCSNFWEDGDLLVSSNGQASYTEFNFGKAGQNLPLSITQAAQPWLSRHPGQFPEQTCLSRDRTTDYKNPSSR